MLASRVVNADLTVVLCPNAVVHNGWTNTIQSAFPTAKVATKTLTPEWPDSRGPRYRLAMGAATAMEEIWNRFLQNA